MASLGSIDHVLKTTFASLYQDDFKRKEAAVAREELRVTKEKMAAAKSAEEQAEETRKQLEAEEIAKKQKNKKGMPSRRESSKRLDTVPVVEEPAIDLEMKEKQDEANLILESKASYLTRFETIEIEEYLRNEYERRVQQTTEEFETKKEQSALLLQYLETQRLNAKFEETKEEEDLKKQGIIVGQHIPSLRSKLAIDRSILEQFGSLSSNILVASELMEENRINSLRRSGNMLISDEAEQRVQQRLEHKQRTVRRNSTVRSIHETINKTVITTK